MRGYKRRRENQNIMQYNADIWNLKCVQSVDEIQDGRFEADEVEVEEVRRNKTTLSCAILLELAA